MDVSNNGDGRQTISQILKGLTNPADAMPEGKRKNYEAAIRAKFMAGKKLSIKEIEYARKNMPDLYVQIKRVEALREHLETELENCKSKEEASKVVSTAINSVGKKDPYRMAVINAYQDTFKEFKKSSDYKALPNTDKEAEEKTSGDNNRKNDITYIYSRKDLMSVWNSDRVYGSYDEMTDAIKSYYKVLEGMYEASMSFMPEEGKLTTEQLKADIKASFPQYTQVPVEPGRVIKGKHLLYIDDENMKHMADDIGYRAKVYGLMKSELSCTKGFAYMNSQNKIVRGKMTGSLFKISEKFPYIEGTPYEGLCNYEYAQTEPEVSEEHQNINRPSDNKMVDLYDQAVLTEEQAREILSVEA